MVFSLRGATSTSQHVIDTSQTTYLFQLINSLILRYTKRVDIYCLNLDFSLNTLQVLRLIIAHSHAQFAEKRKR